MSTEPLLSPEQAIEEVRKGFARMTYETPRGTHNLLDMAGRMLDQLDALAKQWRATETLKAMRDPSPIFIPVGAPEGLPEVSPQEMHRRAVEKAKDEEGQWWWGGQQTITVLGETFYIVAEDRGVVIDVHGTELAYQTKTPPAYAAVRIREILAKRALMADNRLTSTMLSDREAVTRFYASLDESPADRLAAFIDERPILDEDPGGA